MPKILGLDICRSSVVACLLSSKPADPRDYHKLEFPKFQANRAGIKSLLALDFDIAIMEPTGVNYSKFWLQNLERAGKEIRLADHKRLRTYRESLGLPAKDDAADAFALAACYFDRQPHWFIQLRIPIINQMRETIHRLNHLNRLLNPTINRLRQDLAWQFPEVAHVKSLRGATDTPLLWGWMAGRRKSAKYDRLYSETAGSGLEQPARYAADMICLLSQQEALLERELRTHLKDDRFTAYRQIFKKFGFGERAEAILLSQIFPITNFLGEDGRPIIITRKGKKSGKPTKQYVSERRFLKSIGVAPTQEESGQKSRLRSTGGSELCKKALWQWVFTRIEPIRARPDTEICRQLAAELDQKKACKPVKLARSHVAARAGKLLFKELILLE